MREEKLRYINLKAHTRKNACSNPLVAGVKVNLALTKYLEGSTVFSSLINCIKYCK